MDPLESPVEALALNYLTYGLQMAVNSIWAWIAVITAAVSLWSIRVLLSPPLEEPRGRNLVLPSASSTPVSDETAADNPKPAAVLAPGEIKSPPAFGQLPPSPSKTKFSLYYEDADAVVDEDEGGENNGGAAMTGEFGGCCDGDWWKMMVVRMGDLGWYRRQDTAVLDGNVVRLWGGGRRRSVAPLVVDGGGAW